MSVPAWLAPLWPPFLVGLLGGVHCASMCGGIAAAVGLRARCPSAGFPAAPERTPEPQAQPIVWRVVSQRVATDDGATFGLPTGMQPVAAGAGPAFGPAAMRALAGPPATAVRPAAPAGASPVVGRLLAYNAGRIATYTMLGAIAGVAGSAAWLIDGILPVQQAAFSLASLALLLMGLYLLGLRGPANRLESAGRPLWRRLRPLAARSLAATAPAGSARLAATGMLWGLVPCAMVYGVLLAALASGSAAQGAALMFAFGLGTLPNLLALGASAAWLGRLAGLPALRIAAGALLVGFALLGFARLAGAPMGPLGDLLCVVPAAAARP